MSRFGSGHLTTVTALSSTLVGRPAGVPPLSVQKITSSLASLVVSFARAWSVRRSFAFRQPYNCNQR